VTRIKVKICGLTRPEDAALLAEAGADLAGIVLVPASPRFPGERAAEVAAAVPPGVQRVGVFVDEDPDRVRSMIRELSLDLLQFHGRETPEYCRRFGLPYFKAFRVRRTLTAEDLRDYRPQAFLLDAYVPGAAGGTGRTFDWELARRIADEGYRVLLAGGLTPENVASAIEKVGPWGVDVSSGVEVSPGIKDRDKIARFAAAARKTAGG